VAFAPEIGDAEVGRTVVMMVMMAVPTVSIVVGIVASLGRRRHEQDGGNQEKQHPTRSRHLTYPQRNQRNPVSPCSAAGDDRLQDGLPSWRETFASRKSPDCQLLNATLSLSKQANSRSAVGSGIIAGNAC
jgi:hypothetical protein